MSDVLVEICDVKRDHVAARKRTLSENSLLAAANSAGPPRGFARALDAAVDAGGFGLIAEIKRASPSGGLIRPDFDPAVLAKAYQSGGAACLSVLTDAPYFQGADDHLKAARAAAPLPAIRKDFMVDPYQIVESRAIGADCVLLIMAALDDALAAELHAAATDLGMDVLVEVHNRAELERALVLDPKLLGINNRNLKTLAVDLAVTEELAALAGTGRRLISESGIYTHEDLLRLEKAGAKCFLVGESLMRQDNVTAAVQTLLATG